MASGSEDEYRFLPQAEWDCFVLDPVHPKGLLAMQERIVSADPAGMVAAEAARLFAERHGRSAEGEAFLRVRNAEETLDFVALLLFEPARCSYFGPFAAWRGSHSQR
jgi:hypothetical protein